MNDSLEGVRIWLSGSIPDDAAPEEAQRIRDFVSAFAKEVFRRNGRLVHGSHPTIRDTLLNAAREYQAATGQKAGLVLVVSRFFSKEPAKNGINLEEWNAVCAEKVIETREAVANLATGEISRERCLQILRGILVEQCNTIVAVGGKWWKLAAATAGVPQEINLARENHLPLFLLGGLGGATRDYLDSHPELIRSCHNGLTEAENLALSRIENAGELFKQVVDQISLLPLRSRTQESGRPFRILCLDGGGIRGAFSAAVLSYWERATGRNVADHFDLIAGTSTGGILAIGLGLGMKAADMLDFYVKEGGTIFPVEQGISRLSHLFRHWFAAKFDQSVLREKLQAAYATAPVDSSVLDHSLTRLVIPAYNTESDTLIVFRTPHGTGGMNDAGRNPVEVALATVAPPTYFDPLKVGYILAVDGGVWANSPTTVALAEAIHELGVAPERIEMLSIGTTFNPSLERQPLLVDRKMIETLIEPAVGWLPAKLGSLLWKPRRVPDKIAWLPNIAGFLMKTQAQTANYLCERILGDRFVRVDEPTEATTLDDGSMINRLVGLGESLAEKYLQVAKTRFFNGDPADRWR
jgi:patatin-like phospholipase/acyl hydrolase